MPNHAVADPEPAERPHGGRLNAAISNRIVQLVAQYTGRGPTKARAVVEGDAVVCLLQDTLTRGERRLAAGGEDDTILRNRRVQQSIMRREATTAIEELTGRRVVAFMSDNHVEPDLGVEVFVLAPSADGEPAAAPAAAAAR